MNLPETRSLIVWTGFALLVIAALSGIEPILRAMLR